jgi:hypothetical protein
MPRQLTTEFLRGAFAQETGICPVFLLTITHPDLLEPILVSSDPTQRVMETATDVIYGTVSRGKNFLFYPFTLTLPEDGDEGPGQMTLELDNVRRELTVVLRSIKGPPTINADLVLSHTPDVVEAVWPEYLLTGAKYDATTISGTLALETQVREPLPAGAFTPSYFPALFN